MEHKKTEEALDLVRKENDLWRYQNEKRRSKKIAGRQEIEKRWHHQEISRTGLTGKRREVREETSGGLNQKGKAEVPEIIVVTDAVASTFVDLDGGSRPEQVEARLSRREREKHWAKGVRLLCPFPPGVPSRRAALRGCREASGSPCSQPDWSCVTLNGKCQSQGAVKLSSDCFASGVPRGPLAQTWRGSSSQWAKTAT